MASLRIPRKHPDNVRRLDGALKVMLALGDIPPAHAEHRRLPDPLRLLATRRSQLSALLSARSNQEQELLHPLSTPESSCSRGAEEPLVAVVHLEGGQLLQGDLEGLLHGGPLAPASSAEKEASSGQTHPQFASKGYQGEQLGLVRFA